MQLQGCCRTNQACPRRLAIVSSDCSFTGGKAQRRWTRRMRANAAKEGSWSKRIEHIQQSALDSAVGAMNRMISNLEQSKADAPRDLLKDTDVYVRNGSLPVDTETVRLNIKAKTSVLRRVTEVPGKGLQEYLSLPAEDYNSLDSKVVQFLGDNRFRLTPPFDEWFRLNIQPEIILRIQPEPEHSRVLFVCESIKFGDRNIDSAGRLTFISALSREEVTQDGQKGVFFVSAAQLGLSLDTPYKATRGAPMRAFEALSNRVLQATLKACMGPYLDRLIQDYEDWAEGRPRRQATIKPEEAGQLFLDTQATVVSEGVPEAKQK